MWHRPRNHAPPQCCRRYLRPDLQRCIEGVAALRVGHEFKRRQHAGITHFAHQRMLVERRMQLRAKVGAHVRRVLRQVLAFQNVQIRDGRSRANRMT